MLQSLHPLNLQQATHPPAKVIAGHQRIPTPGLKKLNVIKFAKLSQEDVAGAMASIPDCQQASSHLQTP